MVQRGQPAVAATLSQAPAPAQATPNRPGPPPARPGSGGGEWWKDELVVKELQLGPSKARSIDRIVMDRMKRGEGIADEFETEFGKLEQMATERVGEAAFTSQVMKVSFLRSRIWESRQVMLYAMYQVLTPEQHKKLLEIRERNRGRGGRGSH
jgi:Spy/CpxP family protein refolding chaperone